MSHPITPSLGASIAVLATAYQQLHHNDDILQLSTRWLASMQRDLGPRAPQVGRFQLQIAIALLDTGRASEAEIASAHALETYVEQFGSTAYDTADVRVLHGQTLVKLGRIDAARDALEHGANDLAAAAGERDPLTVQAKIALADVLVRQGHSVEALDVIEPAFDAYAKLADPAGRAAAGLTLAEALAGAHREPARVRELARQALAAWAGDPTAWTEEIARAKKLAR